ncbi:MAG: hypothetical protein PHU85_18220 [Phycisphaerae bacterium]|nr:hypothetical protein [Phycisphaerae bacterium]
MFKKLLLAVLVVFVVAAIVGSRFGSNLPAPDAKDLADKSKTANPTTPTHQGDASLNQSTPPAQTPRPQPTQTPKADPPTEPRLTDEQKDYIGYARQYRTACKAQRGQSPVLDLDDSTQILGTLPGNFQISQIIDSRTMIAWQISGEFDLPGQAVWIEGISTKGDADGKKFSFKGNTIFVRKSTKTYTTVLGANRTIYAVEALDNELLEWASRQLNAIETRRNAQEAEECQRRVAAAQVKLDEALASLKVTLHPSARNPKYYLANTCARPSVVVHNGP